MRVLVIYNQYRQTIQGEQIAIDALIDLLTQHGHAVDIYREDTVADDAGWFDKAGATVSSVYNRRVFLAIENQINQSRPDVVHFHNIYPRLGISAIKACEKYNLPTIISLHNYFLTCPILKHYHDKQVCTQCSTSSTFACVRNNCRNNWIESLVYASRSEFASHMNIHQRFDGYIAQSTFAKNFLHDNGVPWEKLYLLRNFSSAEELTHRIDDSTEGRNLPYALFLGRITAEKGVEDVIALAKEKPELNIKVAGGALGCTDWQWPENIHYLGELSPIEARSLLANASCLLFTSRWFEMCPLVLLEAMALKVPIIATNIGGISELVKPGERGLNYSPGDIVSLGLGVEQLLAGDKIINKYVENAYRYVRKAHSADTHYNGLMTIYHEVIKQKTGSVYNDIR